MNLRHLFKKLAADFLLLIGGFMGMYAGFTIYSGNSDYFLIPALLITGILLFVAGMSEAYWNAWYRKFSIRRRAR